MTRPFLLAMALATGCTTLGPMASNTGVSAVPQGRPSLQATVAATPGYYLSAATTEDQKGSAIPSFALLFEPDRWLSLPGLYLAGRVIGKSGTGILVEPVLGYRKLIDRLSLGIAFFGTQGSGDDDGASFRALRVGGEVQGDVRITRPAIVELHAFFGATGTYVSAEGDYCSDPSGHGVSCNGATADTSAEAEAFYPSAHLGLALDIAQHRESAFHGVRVALQGAVGSMPQVVGGVEQSSAIYASVGLSLSVSFGAAD
jgi:hypothetical protein